jgi:outer membrane protein assembly factor BamE
LGFEPALCQGTGFTSLYSSPPAAASKSDMTKFIRILRGSLLSLIPLLALAACTNAPKIPDVPLLLAPYRIDVQQGNVVTQDMVSQLKPGMSREQVKFVLGTPLVADMFHANRWDYIYRFARGTGGVEERKLTVYFDNDVLDHVAGDIVPKSGDAADGTKKDGDVKTADAAGDKPPEEKKGFFARLRERLGF